MNPTTKQIISFGCVAHLYRKNVMRQRKAYRMLIVICFLVPLQNIFAQTMRLADILDSVQQQNPSLKMYDADIRSLDEAAKGAHNWEAPELGTGFWMVPYNTNLWKGTDMGTGMGQYMISAQQMFPNKKKQDAEAKYMEAISSVEKEKKNASLNELYAAVKQNYYEWMIIKKKQGILDQNKKVLQFMIQNAELRYKNGLEKISAYYKAKAALGNIENMQLMLDNAIIQKRIMLNTLMNRDKFIAFDIDTVYSIKDFETYSFDSSTFINTRSDIKAVDKDIQLTFLQQQAESAKLKPEFGVRYDHMFGFGGFPMQYSLMAMVKLPMAKWSSKTNKANVESLKWKAESLNQQKQMMTNELSGMAFGMRNDISLKKKQVDLYQKNILPALQKNFQTMQLGYEQNTEELFMLYDAWETLNMTQLEYLDQLQQLLMMQVQLEEILEVK
ncbi:MAG: TolC family protein [Chitinophagaceae bacterium]